LIQRIRNYGEQREVVLSQSLLFRSAVWFDNRYPVTSCLFNFVAIPSIQVCCLIPVKRLFKQLAKMLKSQSLLFRSAVWFRTETRAYSVQIALVAIPSIQVCCLIPRIFNV